MVNEDAPLPMLAQAPWQNEKTPRIVAVRTFMTAPQGCPYLIVRIETDVPGLYGLGCASDPQRTLAVRSVIGDYYGPMLIGRNAGDIQDIHRLLLNSGYWRGGSIQGNALGAIDVALWDILGKVVGVPLSTLFGGQVREYAAAYTHVEDADADTLSGKVLAAVVAGYEHVRIQVGVPGSDTYGTTAPTAKEQRDRELRNARWDSAAYLRVVPDVINRVREQVGFGVELLHDAHERLNPAQARVFLDRVDEARLYFLEDLLAPEDAAYFAELRARFATPLAVGELYGDILQYQELVSSRSIDFARIRIPTLGGITPVRKLIAAAELSGVRTAPHGPGDVSPVGQAANFHLNISSPNFGVQEAARFYDATLEVFPGAFVPTDGRFFPNGLPGLGVDFDESAAAKYPAPEPLEHDRWTLLRAVDGSVQRP